MATYAATLYQPGKPALALTTSQLATLGIHLATSNPGLDWDSANENYLLATLSAVTTLLGGWEIALLASHDTAAAYGLAQGGNHTEANEAAEAHVARLFDACELVGPILVIEETTPQTSPRPVGGGEPVAEAPSDVVARLTFKDANALDSADLTDEAQAATEAWVRYGEYVTIEVLRDGTARVVPVPTSQDE